MPYLLPSDQSRASPSALLKLIESSWAVVRGALELAVHMRTGCAHLFPTLHSVVSHWQLEINIIGAFAPKNQQTFQ